MLASDAAEIPDAQYVIEGSSSTTRLVDTAGLRRPEPAVMGRTHAEHVATDSADDGSEIPVEDICFREGYCSEDSTESLATPEEVSESANGIQGVPSMSPEPHLDPPAVPAGAPAWFIGTRTALVSLLNKRSPMTLDLRTRWVQVLKLWTLFESKTGFSQPYGRLPISVERPDEIGPWMRAHHRMNAVVVKDVQAFSQKWWLWWNDLNPDWRSRRGGFPIPGGTQQGPWTRLAKRGYSGFILVIISLYWWFPKGLGDPLLGSWSSALRDVSWVLSDIERWEHGAKNTSTKRSGSINSAAAQASKRQKRSSA
ncbi:hypothetical protein B0H21DRAFT_759605 [Amylocystis lapponica]|nr:hypothetical protein B0H21DRAFT_759605 [Amylocystis lapponica]